MFYLIDGCLNAYWCHSKYAFINTQLNVEGGSNWWLNELIPDFIYFFHDALLIDPDMSSVLETRNEEGVEGVVISLFG